MPRAVKTDREISKQKKRKRERNTHRREIDARRRYLQSQRRFRVFRNFAEDPRAEKERRENVQESPRSECARRRRGKDYPELLDWQVREKGKGKG